MAAGDSGRVFGGRRLFATAFAAAANMTAAQRKARATKASLAAAAARRAGVRHVRHGYTSNVKARSASREALEMFFLDPELFFFRAGTDDHNEELVVSFGTA
jgi:hypothetical protein